MKKEIFCPGIAFLVAVMLMAGCVGKEDAVDLVPAFIYPETETSLADIKGEESSGESEVKETLSKEAFTESLAVMAETLGEGYSLAAVESGHGDVEYKFVPTRFPVYQDGKSHYLMYGATSRTYMYAPFTSIAYPEYRVASVSLPSQMINPANGLQSLGRESQLKSSEMQKDVLYDTASRYSTDKVSVHSIETSSFLYRMWAVPYDGDPAKFGAKEMWALYPCQQKIYGLDETMWEESRLESGSYQYSTMCFLRDYVDDAAPNAFARYTVIINDHTAYCYLAGAYSPETAYWLDEYVLKHSFTFQE